MEGNQAFVDHLFNDYPQPDLHAKQDGDDSNRDDSGHFNPWGDMYREVAYSNHSCGEIHDLIELYAEKSINKTTNI